ncbi:hypothetical protein AC52_5210 [Escherichia coli 5-366-08_S3_C3]|nr:hypothetical protein AC52_5210 [Escherichia coli 5-366-08_S3_C3]KEL92569.1 hypothetical protein AB94_2850 [Escherichia coli 5-366-08_S3_C1]
MKNAVRITIDHHFASQSITDSHGGRSLFRIFPSAIRTLPITPGINTFLHGFHC